MSQHSARSAPPRRIRNACLSLCAALSPCAALPGAEAWAFPAPHAIARPLIARPGTGPRHATLILVQTQGEPASFRAEDIAGTAGQPIPLNIELLSADDQVNGQLFILTGLPKGVTLQPGGFFGDFWAVNASVIDELTLTAPAGFAGTFTIWITRSRNQANAPRSASVTVTIGAPPTTPTAAASSASLPDGTSSIAKPRGGVPNEAMLMARATENFGKGDVSGARVIYEYLAMQGSSAAAVAMGETYDPLVLAKLVVKGLDADAKKAQHWYEKAEELGSQDARGRLNALAAR
jgi:hypothetical protein